jgi:hypothetical protein
MKEMNKRFGLGGVNAVIANHERTLCNSFQSNTFKNAHPNVRVEFLKTDFKGYYINCTPTPSCVSIINQNISSIEPPRLPNTDVVFNTINTEASNYQEGYVKTRVISEYPNFRPPLLQFIETEMNEAIRVARADNPDISEQMVSIVLTPHLKDLLWDLIISSRHLLLALIILKTSLPGP